MSNIHALAIVLLLIILAPCNIHATPIELSTPKIASSHETCMCTPSRAKYLVRRHQQRKNLLTLSAQDGDSLEFLYSMGKVAAAMLDMALVELLRAAVLVLLLVPLTQA
jgi:hypothetical protein